MQVNIIDAFLEIGLTALLTAHLSCAVGEETTRALWSNHVTFQASSLDCHHEFMTDTATHKKRVHQAAKTTPSQLVFPTAPSSGAFR
ncbi:hypothetical protein PIB30_013758 [Stylosanthes scabra]|uniref:Secreted protein n=1 Tax=Stylosanthes scabra TaxID=79078 RepID=A0ABU6Z5J3_9FABA|nr:hypothetical protein [Stylosanthes scabra]